MALNADTLLDRIALKTQIVRWRTLAIVLGTLALIALLGQASGHSAIEREYIARLSFNEVIMDDQRLYALIDEVAEDSKAKAVILWLDTPGGSAVAGEELFVRIRALSERKPVVAVMRSVAASAGYMVAIAADHVVAREGTITGSIGVIIETGEVTQLLDKIGVKPIIIKSAPLKASPSPFEKTTPEAEAVIHDVIMDFYDRFVGMVAERRGMTFAQAKVLADGRVFSGKKAVELKLIDALGGESEAVSWLEANRKIKQGIEIKDVSIKEDMAPLQELLQGSIGKIFKTQNLALDGMSAIWHPELH